MYNDGVAYAGLAKNLAHGIGTFWTPRLTEIEYVAFYEHPPLVFGLQSLFFRVLGDALATERVYAFTVFALSGGLIVGLWREALRDLPGARPYWFFAPDPVVGQRGRLPLLPGQRARADGGAVFRWRPSGVACGA